MGAADGEVNIDAFAFDIERVIEKLGSMEAQLDTSAVIDEGTGRVSYGTSVNVDQEVCSRVYEYALTIGGVYSSRQFCLFVYPAPSSCLCLRTRDRPCRAPSVV